MSKSDEQIERESSKRISTAAKKALPPANGGRRGVADWTSADSNLLLKLVCAVGVEGGAVRFGYTRDGGAFSIGIYVGDDKQTYYCNDEDGINGQLEELVGYYKK